MTQVACTKEAEVKRQQEVIRTSKATRQEDVLSKGRRHLAGHKEKLTLQVKVKRLKMSLSPVMASCFEQKLIIKLRAPSWLPLLTSGHVHI